MKKNLLFLTVAILEKLLMMSVNTTIFARVGNNKLLYKEAEMYNKGLQKQGIISDTVQVIGGSSESKSK